MSLIESVGSYELMKELGYKGCSNCKYQIAPLRACKWLEKGGDGVLHLICPKWEKKGETDEANRCRCFRRCTCE